MSRDVVVPRLLGPHRVLLPHASKAAPEAAPLKTTYPAFPYAKLSGSIPAGQPERGVDGAPVGG